jgi:hypothetical protein
MYQFSNMETKTMNDLANKILAEIYHSNNQKKFLEILLELLESIILFGKISITLILEYLFNLL